MRYKKYRYGGKKVPGMYAEDGMEVNPAQPMQPMNQRPNLSPQQMQEQQIMEIMQQMKMQNDSLVKQNELLKTQIEKNDLINSARTTKQTPGASSSPKRKGGSNKKIYPANGFAGNSMRMGGSCLPGGAYSKKKRR
tara:strand:+ start:3948 stop:4355 length:408 start_codon:yes stop_codon:yes gene_type:complete